MKRFLVLLLICLSVNVAQAGQKLTLAESKRLALQNNVAATSSLLETEAARQTRKAAFTKYFPSISALGTVLEADESLMEIATEGGNLPIYDGNPANLAKATEFAYFPSTTMGVLGSMSLGMVSAVHPVFAGGRILNGNKLAVLGVEASEDKGRLARSEVLLVTEEQYWRVVSLEEKLRTVLKYEELLRRLLVQVEDAYDAGLAMKNDVLKVRLKLSEVLLNKSKVENGKALATMAFCQYIGIAYDPAVELEDALIVDGSPQLLRVDHQGALKGRPEYRLLEASVRAEELKTRLKLGELLPQAGVGVAGLYMKMDDMKGKTNGLVFGTISIPLSNWWGGAHEMSARKASEEIARSAMKDNAERLLLQMEKAWQDLADADKQLALCRESEAQAEENLKVNQDSYDNGLSGVSDLLEAQALRQQARDRLTDAMADHRLKMVFYMQVTGR